MLIPIQLMSDDGEYSHLCEIIRGSALSILTPILGHSDVTPIASIFSFRIWEQASRTIARSAIATATIDATVLWPVCYYNLSVRQDARLDQATSSLGKVLASAHSPPNTGTTSS